MGGDEPLQAAPPTLSHAALRVLTSSDPFQEFLTKPQGQGWWPVLRLPPEAAKAIGAKGEVAALSSSTAAKVILVFENSPV